MKPRKTNLDEQQERRLMEIESRGYWLAFWGLLAVLMAEMLIFKDMKGVAGELILFLGLSLYLGISCIRAGIWDRRLDMSRKTCLIASLIAAGITAVFLFSFTFLRFHKLAGSLCAGGLTGLIAFTGCYITLILAARATKKRQDALNAEPEDDTFS